MQPNHTIQRIARKEIHLFFSSPIAYLFLAAFLGITLFIFFWGEAFFSRNIADVRPLFEWLPLLLIFLASTLTMRMWSEERRTGTLEHVMTQPVSLWHFVAGKFLGCLFLVCCALVATLPLPVTVAIMGDLDWGPVITGYLATLLLAAVYLSIGLFVSAQSQNQIVSLLCAVALSGLFYLLGSNTITDFAGTEMGEWLRKLGTGSRFESITRGVLDAGDLVYYLSLIITFLALNTFSLERERWALTGNRRHHTQWKVMTSLIIANALLANVWLGQLHHLRLDMTAGNQYSISTATHHYIEQLQEPLLIRGYFSSKTHPLLSPLVPQMRDLLKEYEIAGKGKIQLEFVDSMTNPELEKEANQKYAIKPVPFQVNDRYQAAVVNSYFNILVKYGEDYQVLGFRDLIETKQDNEMGIDVKLRNPEHDITATIKKVLQSYQASGNLFDTVKGDLTFNAYISSPSSLPKKLQEFKQAVDAELQKVQAKANGRFKFNVINPEANGGKVAEQIEQDFGFKPMATSLFNSEHFYFYLTLAQGDQVVQVPLDDMTAASFERNLSSAIKRFAAGFTKTLALVLPASAPNPYGMSQGEMQFNQLEQVLGTNLRVLRDDLSSGHVNPQADIVLLVAPKNLSQTQLFAVDQFLMQGGTVVLATAPNAAQFSRYSLSLEKNNSGLQEWLTHHGITIEDKLVLDKQSVPFPLPVNRDVGGFSIQEMHMLDYPFFIDVRGEGLNSTNSITNGLPQVTMAWASPIQLNADKQKNHKVVELLRSSKKSWTTTNTQIMPQLSTTGVVPYTPEGEQKSQLLGVISQGRFDSYFAGKPSPLLSENNSSKTDVDNSKPDATKATDSQTIGGVIQHSPESARIIVFSSNDFLADQVVGMAGTATGSQYLNSMQLLANTFEWSLEDVGLLSIRSRSHFNRTLPAMEQGAEMFWEYLNYGLALFALLVMGILHHHFKRKRERQYQQWLTP